MIIVAVTDLHGNTTALKRIAEALSAADLVLLTGDLTNFGRREAAARVVEIVQKYNRRLLAVPGNCDPPEVNDYLTEAGINLHGKSITVDGIAFVGVGGSLPCPVKTPNEYADNELGAFLQAAVSGLSPKGPMLLVAHQAPYNTAVDLANNGKHIGSRSIRNFITSFQPAICFTGHVHEARGIDSIGKTKVINPGPLGQGSYVYAEVNQQVKIAEIRDYNLHLSGQDQIGG